MEQQIVKRLIEQRENSKDLYLSLFFNQILRLNDEDTLEQLQYHFVDTLSTIQLYDIFVLSIFLITQKRLKSFNFIFSKFESKIVSNLHTIVFDNNRNTNNNDNSIFLRLLKDTNFKKEACLKLLSHCLLDTLLFPRNFISYINDNGNNITMQELQYGINLYKNLIDKYPCIQFLTTYCRELPHLYANSLLKQLNQHPLIVEISNNDKNGKNSNDNDIDIKSVSNEIGDSNENKLNNDDNGLNPNTKCIFNEKEERYELIEYELSLQCKHILTKIFNLYANNVYEQDSNNIKIMTSNDFTNYMIACGGGYVDHKLCRFPVFCPT